MPPTPSAPPGDFRDRWQGLTGIPVEASLVRAYDRAGGPDRLGYPLTPGVFVGDGLVQYFTHARLEAPGRASSHAVGVPRLAELGAIMARAVGVGAPAPDAAYVTNVFDDPWDDPARRAGAGQPVGAPRTWQGWWTRWYEREIVRLLPVSPAAWRPVPGHLGALFLTLSEAERARGEGRPSPIARTGHSEPPPVAAPVLTYHLTRGTEPLRAQLQGLLDAGLTPISLEQLVAAIEGWASLPDRPFVVSFDDGWRIQRAEALPVLLELRTPAVFFVMPGFDRFGQGHSSIDDIRAIRAAGFTVGSHTLNHAHLPDLVATNLGAAQAEAVESRQILEREVDGVDFFAYPDGRVDPASRQLIADAGYRAALTTRPGIVHTRDRLLELPRVHVQAWWPFSQVRDAIRAAAQADAVPAPI